MERVLTFLTLLYYFHYYTCSNIWSNSVLLWLPYRKCFQHPTEEFLPHTYILNTLAFSLVEAWQNATNWLKKEILKNSLLCRLLAIDSNVTDFHQRSGHANTSDIFWISLQMAGETMSGFLFGCCCPTTDSWTVVSGFQLIRPHKHIYLQTSCLAN